MPERKYPWSSNKDRSTNYLENLKSIREEEGLPTGRIDDEIVYRQEEDDERRSCEKSDDDCDS